MYGTKPGDGDRVVPRSSGRAIFSAAGGLRGQVEVIGRGFYWRGEKEELLVETDSTLTLESVIHLSLFLSPLLPGTFSISCCYSHSFLTSDWHGSHLDLLASCACMDTPLSHAVLSTRRSKSGTDSFCNRV